MLSEKIAAEGKEDQFIAISIRLRKIRTSVKQIEHSEKYPHIPVSCLHYVSPHCSNQEILA
jgi:hypothetical protein